MLLLALRANAQCNPVELSILTAETVPIGTDGLWFGRSLALSGNTAAVGSRNRLTPSDLVGAVHIFQHDGASWAEEAMVYASDNQSIFHQYGSTVSLDGDTLMVGAIGDSNGGAVYVYQRSGGNWIEQTKIHADDGGFNFDFGSSSSLVGGVAAIGAWHATGGGAVYIFESDGVNWTQSAKIVPPPGFNGSRFGRSVQLSGSSLFVGASSDEQGENSGSVFIFDRVGDEWIEQQELLPIANAELAGFGRGIVVDGDYLAVSAPGETTQGLTPKGVIYVFTKVNGTWEIDQRILPPANAASTDFGLRLAMSSGLIVASSLRDNTFGSNSGAAYVYQNTEHGWVLREFLTASDAEAGDYFGSSVAMDNDKVLIGAYMRNRGTPTGEAGAVYQFDVHCIDSGECVHPEFRGTADTPNQAKGVDVAGGIACIADFNAGLQIANIQNPAFPMIIGSYSTPTRASGVEINGTTACLALGNSGLMILDISDPTSPVLLGEYDSQGSVKDLTIQGQYAYLADNFVGVTVLDISDPANITLVGTHPVTGGAIGLSVHDGMIAVASGAPALHIIVESSPGVAQSTGSWQTALFTAAVDVDFDADLVAVAGGQSGMWFVDISAPETPVLLGAYETTGSIESVKLIGDTAYFTDSDSLVLLDVSDPTLPYFLGHHPTAGDANGIALDGSLICVADGTSGLQVFSIFEDCRACPVDLNNDDTLDFFDISAFLTAFGNQDPIADFTNDGTFDFFDISAFLTAFSAGCP